MTKVKFFCDCGFSFEMNDVSASVRLVQIHEQDCPLAARKRA